MKRERKTNPTTYDFYSNQRNIISTNLTFLFIGRREQATTTTTTITLFKEGSAITYYSFLTYGPQKINR